MVTTFRIGRVMRLILDYIKTHPGCTTASALFDSGACRSRKGQAYGYQSLHRLESAGLVRRERVRNRVLCYVNTNTQEEKWSPLSLSIKTGDNTMSEMKRYLGEYMRFRRDGYKPRESRDFAKAVILFSHLDTHCTDDDCGQCKEGTHEIGECRLVTVPETESYFSVYGKPDSEEERKSIVDAIENYGCVTLFAQVWNGDSWQTAYSVGFCIYHDALDPHENAYAVDAMREAIALSESYTRNKIQLCCEDSPNSTYGYFIHQLSWPQRNILPTSDYDSCGFARSFGWSPQPCKIFKNRGIVQYCEHDATDGTIDCPDCGRKAAQFISEATAYLQEHCGRIAEDPGYFD